MEFPFTDEPRSTLVRYESNVRAMFSRLSVFPIFFIFIYIYIYIYIHIYCFFHSSSLITITRSTLSLPASAQWSTCAVCLPIGGKSDSETR